MESAVPRLYARFAPTPLLRGWGRILAGIIALACLTPLIIATRLAPSHTGIDTHRGLGLPTCSFLDRTGLPCPTCGMTTSFAWFVRGNLLASFYVQPMGFIVAALCAMTFWVGLYIGLTGKPVHQLLTSLPIRYHLLPLMAITVAGWAWKILIHLRGIDGW